MPETPHQLMSPGDLVRHADYPQWGPGYVIRAKKTSSDVFFRWGGKRKRLRLDLVEGFSRLPYGIAACMEPALAAWLRAQGFAVWQN